MTMIMRQRRPLLLLPLLLVELSYGQDYDAIAANFGATTTEILDLGGLPHPNCTFSFNNTVENCEALIGEAQKDPEYADCDCYNFCGSDVEGCFDAGTMPPLFECPLNQVVAGCQAGVAPKASPLTPSEGSTTPCPEGYMCTKDKQKKCDDIRQIPIDLGLGDVHAGVYCPGRADREENGYLHCDAGYYCPNATTMIPCPAGFFCPHKTAIPEIPCDHCAEGAATLSRDPAGYSILAVIIAFVLFLVGYEMFKRYNSGLYDHIRDLQGRNLDKVRAKIQRGKRQDKLKRLQPKLHVIESRLKKSVGDFVADPKASSKAINTETESGKIKFDVRRLFDLMDTNGDGELSYDEINNALELGPLQLREFIRRMNQAAKMPPETENISRDVFIKSFLVVLEQISHFEPTATEADELFDDIVVSQGTVDLDGVTHESLFDSPLADFLDEKQINQLIRRFRQLQEKHHAAGLFNRRGSLTRGGTNSERGAGGGMDSSMPENNSPPMAAKEGKRASFLFKRGESDSDVAPAIVSRGRRSSISRSIRRASMTHKKRNSGDETGMAYSPFKFRRPSILTFQQKFDTITREEFIAWYPTLLIEITSAENRMASNRPEENTGGVDIAFENLSLTVTVKNNQIKIVDKVTGRLQAGTMTALMGGSGAGKTSLLNALCGRAFYGEVTGLVKINGHKTSIEEHASAVGFVPQDDIVYAELTVRENLIFSGKFQLPKGTPMKEIEDLADETMAGLGLSRVMHSMVGDVTRRGVSGGEKKRVNIGLELMARPKIVFLDEPTSGLDSNSALLVMESLKTLVNQNGTTICSVIHQPRKFIFELFDSLILLGVGGKLVYHGPTSGAEAYFKKLHYVLPSGESIADWLIDISSGRLGPSKVQNERVPDASRKFQPALTATAEEDSAALDMSASSAGVDVDALINPPPESAFEDDSAVLPNKEGSTIGGSELMIASMQDLVKSTLADGSTDLPAEDEAAQAKARREVLYEKWRAHFAQLSDAQREIYSAPEPYDLPGTVEKAALLKQVGYQLQRCIIVTERNWLTKVIDTSIIVGAVILVSILDGTEQPTFEADLGDLNYDRIAEPSTVRELVLEFPKLFSYAIFANLRNLQGYASKLGVLIAVLVGLTACKTITSKRKEFFREAGSGYNVNAYFIAVNVMATIEHSIQVLVSALCAVWLRNALSNWYSTLVSFLMVGWIAVSWAFLFPLIVPADNVVMALGFYMVLFSLLFSGNVEPVKYENIYANDFLAIFSGLLSPTRYFIEALAVVESRCLPVQSGFTNFGPNFSGDALQTASFVIMGQGLNDFGEISIRSFDGWYWGVLPAFCVGLWIRWMAGGVIHISDRPKQAKKPLLQVLDGTGYIKMFVYFVILFGLLGVSIWLILREVSTVE